MVLTGIVYPFFILLVAQLIFPWQANGSLLKVNNRVVGSRLIGQSFTSQHYFWGRPSATLPYPYNALHSMGSNLSMTNPMFLKALTERSLQLRQTDPKHQVVLPVDLVTASASGLDPDISPLAAYYQIPRIAAARFLSETTLQALVTAQIEPRAGHLLGEPRVNVLALNLALDQLCQTAGLKP